MRWDWRNTNAGSIDCGAPEISCHRAEDNLENEDKILYSKIVSRNPSKRSRACGGIKINRMAGKKT